MTESGTIDEEAAWAAVEARDRAADGRFVTGVLTTGIYCRPSCPARHPRRQNVRFFAGGAAAEAAGLRACLRCRPNGQAADGAAVEAAVRLIETSGAPPSLDALAAAAGYSPAHFHRLFRRLTGVTPAAYARAVRARRAADAIRGGASVTDAIYEAGYAAPSRFYAEAADRLGMAPAARRGGAKGETIRWACVDTRFGAMLLAATARGICRLSFDVDPASLARHFPRATIEPGDEALSALAERAVAAVDAPGVPHDLPLDIAGTAFQEAVWQALSRIPPGETLSYAALAAAAGKPGASRAAGSACGANPVAVLVPCHRVLRGDGSPGGYAWGLARKRAILAGEGVALGGTLDLGEAVEESAPIA